MSSPAESAPPFAVEASKSQSFVGQATRRPSSSGKSEAITFPGVDEEADQQTGPNGTTDGVNVSLGTLIDKVPESLWQANGVVPQHRRKAHLYWMLLVAGYAIYVALVSDHPATAVLQ